MQLRERHDELAATAGRVIAVAPGGTGRYIDRAGPFPFTMVTDDDHSAYDAYDVTAKLRSLGQRPALFVLDPKGQVTYNQVGTWQTDLPPVDEILEHLAAAR